MLAPRAAGEARVSGRALEERAADHAGLPAQPARARTREGELISKGVERRLPAGYDVDTHFKPSYNPWDQRLCLVPDGDLFAAISKGSASVVTDRIETFTERRASGCESGAELEADLVVTATGLNLLPLGGVAIAVDGQDVELPRR